MKNVLTALILLLTLSACSERPLQYGDIIANPKDKSEGTGIVGGTDVEPTNFHIEHTVLITGKYSSGENYSCTGTLIDYDIILTAAHCIGKQETMKITFGENPIEDGPIDIFKARTLMPHMKYNKTSEIRNDIALIQLESTAPENFYPALLPFDSKESVRDFKSITVYGFGITSGVTINGKLNKKSLGVMRTTSLEVTSKSKSGDVFAVNQTEGKGICVGDSGGPAFVRENIVVGVISRGITDDPNNPAEADNDICNYESVLTSVAYYQDWILKGIKKIHKDSPTEDDAPEF